MVSWTSAGKESPNTQFIHSARCCWFFSLRWGRQLSGRPSSAGPDHLPVVGSQMCPRWRSHPSLQLSACDRITQDGCWFQSVERGRWLMSVISMLCRVVWQWSWRGAPGALVLVCEGEQSITWACTSWDWLRMDRLSLTEGSTWVLFYHNVPSVKGYFFFSMSTLKCGRFQLRLETLWRDLVIFFVISVTVFIFISG